MTSETIVAVYSDAEVARRVVSELESSGVPSSAIETYSSDRYNVAERDGLAGTQSASEHQGGFWSWLFGEEQTDTTGHHHTVYDQTLQRGGTVVTVITHEADAEKVISVLERHNPVDIEEHSETGTGGFATTAGAGAGAHASGQSTGLGATGATATTGAFATRETTRPAAEGDRLTLSEEQLIVGKREVERGTARLRRYVVSRPVEEQVRLREETVSVFRRPVTGTDQVPGDAFTDKVVEMREVGEEAVVGKTARVVEEVGLEKKVGERVETVRDTVRKEEVEVVGADRGRTGTESNLRMAAGNAGEGALRGEGTGGGAGIGAGSGAATGVGPNTGTGVGTGTSSGGTAGRTGTI